MCIIRIKLHFSGPLLKYWNKTHKTYPWTLIRKCAFIVSPSYISLFSLHFREREFSSTAGREASCLLSLEPSLCSGPEAKHCFSQKMFSGSPLRTFSCRHNDPKIAQQDLMMLKLLWTLLTAAGGGWWWLGPEEYGGRKRNRKIQKISTFGKTLYPTIRLFWPRFPKLFKICLKLRKPSLLPQENPQAPLQECKRIHHTSICKYSRGLPN